MVKDMPWYQFGAKPFIETTVTSTYTSIIDMCLSVSKDDDDDECFEEVADQASSGATKLHVDQCKLVCSSNSSCAGFDRDSNEECWFHTAHSISNPQHITSVDQYTRSCHPGK